MCGVQTKGISRKSALSLKSWKKRLQLKPKMGHVKKTFIVLCSIILTEKCISRNFLNQS